MTVTVSHPDRSADLGTGPGLDANAYRSLLTFAAEESTLDRILEQLASWLRPRGLEVDLTQSRLHTTPKGELMLVHHKSAAGRAFRARLTESTPTGRWITELTTHLPPKGHGWLALNVSNNQGRSADVPRLGGYLLDVLETYDGAMTLSSGPSVVGASGLDDLLDAVCDPDRHGLLLVAGTNDEQLFDPFVDRVRYWTRNTRGLAQAVVLDPNATAQFADMIGAAHAVTPWTLRSFQQSADPAWEPDARRHKVLGTARLARQPDSAIRALLGRIARTHASQRPMPAAVTRVSRDLARLEDRLLVDTLFASQATPPIPAPIAGPADTAIGVERRDTPATADEADPSLEQGAADTDDARSVTVERGSESQGQGTEVAYQAAIYLAQVELTKQLLGIDELEETALTEIAELVGRARRDADSISRITLELAARQQRIADIEDEVAFHKELYNEEEFYRVVAEDERRRAEDTARWLRQQLREKGNPDAANAAVPDEIFTLYPDSFDALLARLGEVQKLGVFFTGDPEVARGLDDVDGNSKIVRSTWEALLVLGDYVAARVVGNHEYGVQMYLEKTPSGYRPLSPKKHAPKESESTMNRWGNERILPVPLDADPSGRACMEAHFKLGRVGMVSPRMHYLDDYAKSGRMYVGYIGPHLTTATTN